MCEAWAKNIEKINAPIQLAAARNWNTYRGYDGERFVYCPWCGCLLTQSDGGRSACFPPPTSKPDTNTSRAGQS